MKRVDSVRLWIGVIASWSGPIYEARQLSGELVRPVHWHDRVAVIDLH